MQTWAPTLRRASLTGHSLCVIRCHSHPRAGSPIHGCPERGQWAHHGGTIPVPWTRHQGPRLALFLHVAFKKSRNIFLHYSTGWTSETEVQVRPVLSAGSEEGCVPDPGPSFWRQLATLHWSMARIDECPLSVTHQSPGCKSLQKLSQALLTNNQH